MWLRNEESASKKSARITTYRLPKQGEAHRGRDRNEVEAFRGESSVSCFSRKT